MSREELEKRLKDVKDRIKMIDVELEDEEYPVEPEERESLIREKNELERQQKELEEQISNMQENEENTNEEPIAEFEASGRIDFRNNYLNALQQANIDPSNVYDPHGITGEENKNEDAEYELSYGEGGAYGSDDGAYNKYTITKRKKIEKIIPEPEPEPKKEPLMFGEILSKIDAAQNALSYGQISRYQFKDVALTKVKYDKGDWVHNSLRWIGNTAKLVVHGIRKIYSKIFTTKATKEKMEKLKKNIDELPADEFETLYKGLQSYKGHENAVSPSVRQCVLERATRETQNRNIERNKVIKAGFITLAIQHKKSAEIAELLKNPKLTEKEKADLIAQKENLDRQNVDILREIEKAREEGALEQGGGGIHGLEEENRAAREGSNIQGRKFGKRFTKNVELEKEQAAIEARMRIAREKGNSFDEVQAFLDHEMLMEENTNSGITLGVTHNTGDRNRCEGVFYKGFDNDDAVSNIITIVGTAMVARGLIKAIQDASIIKQYNQDVMNNNAVNATEASRVNSSIQHQNQQARMVNQQIADLQNNVPGARAAVQATEAQTERMQTFASLTGAHDVGGAGYKWRHGWGASPEDIALHTAESTGIAPDINATMQNAVNTFKGWPFDRSTTVRAAEEFMNNGGKAVLNYGPMASERIFKAIEQLKPCLQSLNGLTYTPQGTIVIRPDYLTPIALAAITLRGTDNALARKARNKREKRNKWKTRPSKGNELPKDGDNENRQNSEEDIER